MKILGYGSYGMVRLGSDIHNPCRRYAIKTVQKDQMSGKAIYLLKNELEALRSVDHPNIVKLYETYEDEYYFHMVMEYCEGGDLLSSFIRN